MFCSLKNNANRNNDADEQHNPVIRRSRFTAPIADLSALGGYSAIRIVLLKVIIAPCFPAMFYR
jgi:hypothetical protein